MSNNILASTNQTPITNSAESTHENNLLDYESNGCGNKVSKDATASSEATL